MGRIRKNEIEKLREQLSHCEELLRLRTRQLFTLMTTAELVAETENLHKQLAAIAQGIVDAKLFKRALISIFGRNWKRIDMGYAGFSRDDINALKKNKPLSTEMWHEILSERFRVSKSYFVSHNHPLSEELDGIPSMSDEKEFEGWHPNDFFFVPLRSHTGRLSGIISVDDPVDGKKPTAHSETVRLLELFAHRAALLIERNQLLKRLRHQEAYLKKLIASSAEIIITTDEKGKINVFNTAAEQVLGFRQAEIRGRSVLKLYKDSRVAHEVMREMRFKHGAIQNAEVDVVSRNGEIIPLSLSATILHDELGNEIGTVGVSRDLRHIRELQQKLLDAEKRAAVQKTVVALSHHIHNQLMAQVALLTHLREDLENNVEDPKFKQYCTTGLTKALERSFQIAHITKTLQNPPEELKEEKYIGELEMLSLPQPTVNELPEFACVKLHPLNILVADDEPIIRNGFAEFLRHFKMNVDIASDGKDAIELISQNNYDLVISDIKMPYATGYDVFKAAKDKNPDTQVILMTAFGYDPEHTIVKAAREGLKGVYFKEKPFDLRRLLESISKLFCEKNPV